MVVWGAIETPSLRYKYPSAYLYATRPGARGQPKLTFKGVATSRAYGAGEQEISSIPHSNPIPQCYSEV